ncbi:MAG TPA: FKBP-type peptidyl-prolyl cis-trans isomerase [Flavobacteriales bacterium]|nr:FKBP-type peptidyl-prolyl cis-trans isomerase [Flavobacteriales bacterium]
MNKIIISLLAIAFVSVAQAQNTVNMTSTTNASSVNLKNAKDSVSYSLGILIAKNLKQQGFTDINIEAMKVAMEEVLKGAPTACTDAQAQANVQQFAQKAQAEKAAKNVAEGKAFLEKNKAKKGVKVTPSGLQYEVLKDGGAGAKPGPNSQVTAHYHGTLIDGTVFDSSVQRNQPFKTGVGQVIKAWQEALQLMTPGTKLRIVCPPDIAYGERGAGQMIGPNSVLVFEMELISIDVP